MAAALLFHDLGLLADDSSSSSSRLLLSARALELGYAAVALDHPHRGLLANSHHCSTQPIAPLSSLPLPPSAALHRRLLASPTSEPFRQLTRITLSIDSPAAAASALAPSAARLLRTYDIVAARPLNQAAFDHLCQVPYSQQLDLVSIDFSHKLPFRLKLPMLKLALQRGLHFEIAYSPFLATDGDKCILADAKLLADWTKGKNLIISSAACTATKIRGPYDVINLCSYLLGLPMNRAKAAISTNPRSLILKALRKKHFYKETIRIERLLPHEKLDSTKFMLDDWIEQPTIDEEIPSQAQDETVQADIVMDHGLPVLPVSFDHQDTGPYKPGNHEDVMDHFVQAVSDPSVDLKSDGKHGEFDQDAMKVDATESCRLNLIAGSNVSSISETCIKSNVQDQIDCVSNEAEKEKTPLAHEISSRSDVCFKDMDVDQSIDIPVDTEACNGTSEAVECPPGGKDDKEPTDRSIDEGIEQIVEGEVESTYLKTRKDISVEPLFQGQDISSTGYMYPKNSADTNCKNDELKEEISEETIASLQKNTADAHEQSLNYPYPSSKVEIITVKSEKRRRKVRSHHSAYLPFLGSLKSAHFKRKVCRKRDLVKPISS
ncbi:hypothetical protein QOZ80_9AG0671740 [Eleusine coracana subsp. coracana]|nr:hypothetical protein QOZ80_9AG0671740 [Eleusine coracana subsp. coracana]